jgi:glycosyltransferase involved in cell wall biosynthesis
MKLLFITHKIHEQDDDFAFASLWVREFIRQGFEVEVICLEKGAHGGDFVVFSLGKERGTSTLTSLKEFWRTITTLKYDRVFVHMNPKWVLAGALYWWIKKIPVYLWYTHYTMHLPLRVSHFLCKRLFCATPESMPQYNGDPKKVVTGHGVDLDFWNMKVEQCGDEIAFSGIPPRENRRPKTDLLAVHRICRSKRLHLAVGALKYLPPEYNLTVYGRVLEQDYYDEVKKIISELGVGDRVHFMGSVPMPKLRGVYPNYQIMVNMAPATIDKTVIEGMLCGVEPVTTAGNAKAIGLPNSPSADTPEAIAQYIKNMNFLDIKQLQQISQDGHSLAALVEKMGEYIKRGI